MKWLRLWHQGSAIFGTLDGDHVHLQHGDMFGAPSPSGETLALDDVEWLAPCTPGNVIGLWNTLSRCCREKRLGATSRTAVIGVDRLPWTVASLIFKP